MLKTLTPWRATTITPWQEGFTRMQKEFEELLDRLFHAEDGGAWFTPRVDMTETETEFEVKVDLPGLKPEEVKVELRNGELWITGERKEEKEEKDKTYHRVERRHGEFRRVLPIPAEVNEERIEARFENGVLTVTIPKAETAKPKVIEVKA